MSDLKDLFKDNFLSYASYVILDRAIPDIVDGLKPVQRRILYTLFQMDDGKLHKVANVAGQTMALHPHGDAPIVDAIVNLANRDFLLDKQGNFGNPFTGDSAAAARYIETRLSSLAKEVLFNSALTEYLPSYDGRAKEPVALPAKIPLLLLQGAEGIAVGMATKILPHNFQEVLKGAISILEDKSFRLLPDFSSGGVMDPSEYDKGRGKIKLRAKIDTIDDKTLVIREICYSTTTESLIRSIDEAAKKGKIKIEEINDYTAEKIEIEIKLPRGQYAKEVLNSLYAFTDCEVTIHSQIVAIKEKLPWEGTVNELLEFHTTLLQGYLKKELELRKEHLLQKIFERTLEQVFIENRLYKKIEEINSYEKIHKTIAQSFVPFHKELSRVPTQEDQEKLLSIPLRRITRFDIEKNQQEIQGYLKELAEVEKSLKSIKKTTIKYLETLLQKYGSLFPRKTKIKEIEEIDVKQVSLRTVKVGYDSQSGYLGTKVTGDVVFECSNYDKLLLLYEEGSYMVISVPEKQYVHNQKSLPAWIGKADKTQEFHLVYKDETTGYPYGKRFVIKQFILNKIYRFLGEGQKLAYLSAHKNVVLQLEFKPKARQKTKEQKVEMSKVPLKGVATKGIRLAHFELKKIKAIVEQ